MSFAGAVIIVALCLVVLLALVVTWQWQDRKRLADLKWKAEIERDKWDREARRLSKYIETIAEIEGARNEQKDKVAAGGFDASVSVLSDIAARTNPKT